MSIAQKKLPGSKKMQESGAQWQALLRQTKDAAYLPLWYFRSRILGQKWPLQTVLFVTDYCNLKCRHCMAEGHKGSRMKPYEEIRSELEYSYALGSRFVDFEGGEPTLWRDEQGRTLNDLYKLAKEIGFFSCTLTTNGQNRLQEQWRIPYGSAWTAMARRMMISGEEEPSRNLTETSKRAGIRRSALRWRSTTGIISPSGD